MKCSCCDFLANFLRNGLFFMSTIQTFLIFGCIILAEIQCGIDLCMMDGYNISRIMLTGFNCWFSSAPVFQWCCSTPQGSPGVGHNTLFLSCPHLCFNIVFICDLFVSRDDPLMG